MRLLIITQKVDQHDPILGFFHRWLEEFSKHCQSIVVICLEKGDYDLPNNVRVLSLGKEKGLSRIKYASNFYKYIWQEKNNYDAVFVHMNPEYVVLGGLFWRAWHKQITFWYAHKSVNLKLKLATKLTHIIFTASSASFRLQSKKVKITGHGIDTDLFKPGKQPNKAEFKIICVGRVSATKNQMKLLQIFNNLKSQFKKSVKLDLIGTPVTDEDKKYLEKIKNFILDNNLSTDVNLVGPLEQAELAKHYQVVDLLVNLSTTGSLDKDVLEAMAVNLDILTTNEAFKDILPKQCLANNSESEIKNILLDKIEQPTGPTAFRAIIESNHSLPCLIKTMVDSF